MFIFCDYYLLNFLLAALFPHVFYVYVCICASQRSRGCLQGIFVFTLLSETGYLTEPGSHHLFRDRMPVSSRGQSVNTTPRQLAAEVTDFYHHCWLLHTQFLLSWQALYPLSHFPRPFNSP